MIAPTRTARLVLLLLIVASAGCDGSHTAGPTRVTVTYDVGPPANGASEVRATCPPGARCSVERIPYVSPGLWTLIARYTLTCNPAGRSHPDSQGACAALHAYVAKTRGGSRCLCPLVVRRADARGELDGRPAAVGLDACAACGHPGTARPLRVLLPQAD